VLLCICAIAIAFADERLKHPQRSARIRRAASSRFAPRIQQASARHASKPRSLTEISSKLRSPRVDKGDDGVAYMKDAMKDPFQGLKARIETVKDETDEKIQQMNHEQELSDLQVKLDKMATQQKQESSRAATTEVNGLEGRIDKMEQTTKDLKRAASEQLNLLKAIQNHKAAPAVAEALHTEDEGPPAAPLTPLDVVFRKLTGELNQNSNSVTITSPRLISQINSYATLANAPPGTPYGLSSVPSGLVRPRVVDRNYIRTAYDESGFDEDHLNNIALNPAVHNQLEGGDVLSRVTDGVGHEAHLPGTLELYPTEPEYRAD